MPGDYTDEEVRAMSRTELLDAAENHWRRMVNVELPDTNERGEIKLPSAVPAHSGDVWATNAKHGDAEEFDYIVPSGQTCRLRKVTPEMLLPLGILNRVTRLEGLADTLVTQAEGQPPKLESMPTQEELELLLETLDLFVPVAVVQPRIYSDNDPDAPEGAIRVKHIDLTDRVAIMERCLKGVALLDRFRNAR